MFSLAPPPPHTGVGGLCEARGRAVLRKRIFGKKWKSRRGKSSPPGEEEKKKKMNRNQP